MSVPPPTPHREPLAVKGPEPLKAYKNEAFLNSRQARAIRISCELEEPRHRLEAHRVDNIVMFFGSARARDAEGYAKAMNKAKEGADVEADANGPAHKHLARLEKQAFLVKEYEKVTELARLLTAWNLSRKPIETGETNFVVGTGGGPGMMEAANKGARVAEGQSLGFGISLPFESCLNQYVDENLAFEFHYFMTRKFWMAYKCAGLIVAPGGFGTLDELFELLTLMQTNKIRRHIPVILVGKLFWDGIINYEKLVATGMISQDDVDQLIMCDTAEEAFEALRPNLEKMPSRQW